MTTDTLDTARSAQAIEITLREHMMLYGYEPISIPVISAADIFLTRAGDTIIDRLFTFERYGQQLALRPEFTAVVAQHYVNQQPSPPQRWQYSGVIFEDFPDDHSLQFEAQSVGAEFIGKTRWDTDAEIIAMAVQGIEKVGIDDYRIIIGHVGLQMLLLAQFGLDSRAERLLLAQRETLRRDGFDATWEYVKSVLSFTEQANQNGEQDSTQTQQMLDVLLDSTKYGTTMGGRSRHDIAQRLLMKHERSHEESQIREALEFLAQWGQIRDTVDSAKLRIAEFITVDAARSVFEDWFATIDMLRNYGIDTNNIVVQADLTKNWEYYTGMVFGIDIAEDVFVASGGRYDSLVNLLDESQDAPAVGFAYYMKNIITTIDTDSQSASLTIFGEDESLCIQVANTLRQQNIPVTIIDGQADILVNEKFIQYADNRYETLDALVKALQ